MSAPRNFLSDVGDLAQLQGIARPGILPEAIPRGHPVILNLARFHRRFEKRKGLADTVQKLFLGHFRELSFRIMQVVDVHAFHAQII